MSDDMKCEMKRALENHCLLKAQEEEAIYLISSLCTESFYLSSHGDRTCAHIVDCLTKHS